MENLRDWLALIHVSGIGPVQQNRLLTRYGSPQSVFELAPSDHELSESIRKNLKKPDWESVERSLQWLNGDHCHLVTQHDKTYPRLLLQLNDAPPLLFVMGNTSLLNSPQIAMVGSRNPTRSGAETAHEFGRFLGSAGLTVTSGLALGIDAQSHIGALDGGGDTIAVLGTGADRIYPASHHQLAHRIVDSGSTILSEFAPGTPPLPGNFPKRNRIISGMSMGTIVVEAALKSGSLITARLAGEQGREVYAIPGSIHNPLARGCHQLIRQGAKLVESGRDILEELAPQLQQRIDETPENEEIKANDSMDLEYRELLKNIGDEATSVDQVVEHSGLSADVVSSMLLMLELQGYVTMGPGGYVRTSKR
jgi:DNA processing protein